MQRTQGFTLIELMIVVAIIGILGSMAVPAWQYQVAKSRQTEARTNLSSIFDLEIAFHGESNAFGSLAEIGYVPDGATHYTYCVGVDSCMAATVPLDYGASGSGSGAGSGGGMGIGSGSGSGSGTGSGTGKGSGSGGKIPNAAGGVGSTSASSGGGPGSGTGVGAGSGSGSGSGGGSGSGSGSGAGGGGGALNGHYSGDSFEADAYGRISSAPSPNDVDAWIIDDSRELVNVVVGY